jgi:hypothetical protein
MIKMGSDLPLHRREFLLADSFSRPEPEISRADFGRTLQLIATVLDPTILRSAMGTACIEAGLL